MIDALLPGKMHVHHFHEVRCVPGWCSLPSHHATASDSVLMEGAKDGAIEIEGPPERRGLS